MAHKKTIIVTVVIVLIATCTFAATTIPSPGDDESKTEQVPGNKLEAVSWTETKPVNVKTAKAATERLTEFVTARGVTSAKTDVTFSAEMPGRIEYIGPDLGQRVRKGQVLARIDYQTLQAQKNQAQASFDLADSTYNRLATLGGDLVSHQKIDEVKSQKTSAKAMLAIARTNLNKSIVRSNMKGVVASKYVDKAEYVNPGTPMYRIVDHRTIIIEAQLPESQVALVNPAADVWVTVDALGEQRRGKIDVVLATADPVSKMFTIRVTVENPDLKILVGMSATLKVVAEVNEAVVTVPQDLVVEGKNKRSLFVAVNGTAQERVVRLGAIEGDRVVILEGVDKGEQLIVSGHRSLNDGQLINVVN